MDSMFLGDSPLFVVAVASATVMLFLWLRSKRPWIWRREKNMTIIYCMKSLKNKFKKILS